MSIIRAFAIGNIVLLGWVAGAAAAGEGGVECSWKCHCARQLDDCDANETQWDLCLDVAATRHPNKVESCDACKQVAATACQNRVCPPDPAQGPKSVFQTFCDGRSQYGGSVSERLGSAVATSPSVGVPLPEGLEKLLEQEQDSEAAKAADQVTCSFGCSCGISVGMCDRQEERTRLCLSKKDETLTARNCGACEIRARVRCFGKPCPIAANTTKVMTRFQCPG